MIHLKSPAQSLIESNLRMRVIRESLRLRTLRARQIPLVLHHLIRSRRPQIQLLLIPVERLLRKDSPLHRRVVPRPRLL